MKFIKQCAVFMLLVLLGTGCSSMIDARSFMHPEADFSFYQQVGVLPFANQTDDDQAGDKVTEHFLTEVLINGDLAVLDPGQFNAVVSKMGRSAQPGKTLALSPEQFAEIADIAKVQGIFEGIVHEYHMIQLGGERYPAISMTVKFIDAPTGTIVWQSNVTARGGPNLPIVSIGESFLLGELTQKVVKKVVKDFYNKADI